MSNTILEERWEDNYYLKLSSDFDSRLALADISSCLVTESFNFNSPLFLIRFTDAFGDLITHNRISPDSDYKLSLGRDEENAESFDFQLSKNTFQTTAFGKTENVLSQIYFVSSKWKDFIATKKHRSWKEKKYSEVVREIVSDLGFQSIEIEETDGKFDILQPGWTDYQLLKWMVKRCVNVEGIGGYEIGITFDNRFIFKTVHSLINQRPIKEYYFGGEDYDVEKDYFFNIEIIQDYADLVKQGGSGYRYSYFNYETKEYVTDSMTPSDTDQRQLSDWLYITENHEGDHDWYYGGRSTDTPDKVQTRILNTTNSIQKLKIDVRGNVDLHIGDIIKLYIAPTEHSKLKINEFYSGHYMITKVAHEINFGGKDFITQLTLSRQGVNGTDIEGFVETSAGKQVRG